MTRYISIVGAIVLAVIIGMIAWNMVYSPTAGRRARLERELAALAPHGANAGMEMPEEIDALQQVVAEKPQLWEPLVAPPRAPGNGPAAPDLDEMLRGVTATRREVGARVLIEVPDGDGRVLVGVGDRLRGLTVKEIARTHVVFSLTSGGTEYTKTLPRE